MDIIRTELTETQEFPSRKVSLTRIVGSGKGKTSSVIGWEISPPQKGERYCIQLGGARVLRTSTVQSMNDSEGALVLKTLNSSYRIEYIA